MMLQWYSYNINNVKILKYDISTKTMQIKVFTVEGGSIMRLNNVDTVEVMEHVKIHNMKRKEVCQEWI